LSSREVVKEEQVGARRKMGDKIPSTHKHTSMNSKWGAGGGGVLLGIIAVPLSEKSKKRIKWQYVSRKR